jgi:hypothetical protein
MLPDPHPAELISSRSGSLFLGCQFRAIYRGSFLKEVSRTSYRRENMAL